MIFAARLINSVLIFALVVCPYTCDKGCCAAGETQSQIDPEQVFGGCSKCCHRTENDQNRPLPQPSQESPSKHNCICAGAIEQNVNDSVNALETLRMMICCTTATMQRTVNANSTGSRFTSQKNHSLAMSGRALRTLIASLKC